MLQPRNTTPSAGGRRRPGWLAVLPVLALAAHLGACADGPSAPVAPEAPLASKVASSERELEKVAKREAKEQERAARRLEKAEFERLKKEWKAYKKAVESGAEQAVALRCEPTAGISKTKRIGPNGGRIDVGSHSIEIPAGALDAEVEITASVEPGPRTELEFAPHGLQFAKPVELSFDYSKCLVPESQALDIVYVGPGWRLLETMPSSDARGEQRIRALTDHFSGYMVSTGRR